MSRYPLGQPVRQSTTVTQLNVDGTTTLVNATALTLLVKVVNADGTTTTTGTYASPTNDSTGKYHQDIPVTDLTIIGHYQFTWTATGTGAGVSFGDFDIFDPFEPAFLTLADAKDACNIPQATTTSDAELAGYVATIETCLEGMTGGPLVNRTITSERCTMTADQSIILLRRRPVVSVTSIVAESSGVAVDITGGLDIDPNAGTVQRQFTGWPFILPTFSWQPIVLVTYVAGWGTATPAAFNTAGRIILQNLWNTQHGPAARPSMGATDQMVTLPGFGFLIPSQAAEILKGSLNGMSFMQEVYI